MRREFTRKDLERELIRIEGRVSRLKENYSPSSWSCDACVDDPCNLYRGELADIALAIKDIRYKLAGMKEGCLSK